MNKHTTKRFNRSLLSCALAACLAMSAPLMAQSTAATLRGQAAAGATVTATNVDTGLSRSAAVNASGGYTIPGLPPGTYRVEGGTGGTRNITLAVGQVATVDLAKGPATADGVTNLEGVVAVGELTPETRTSEVATYVSQKQIEALPQGTRNFLAFADTVPGMAFSQDNNGNTRLRSGAQNASAINVFIDGVGQKNYVLPGGITGQDSSRGNPFPQSAIGEYKVITQNYKAEYDQLSSAAIVAVTRSGSNEFTGDIFWDGTKTDWRSKSRFEEQSGTKARSEEQQYGVSFGGPIKRDVAHFFLAYEAKSYESPVTFNLGRGYTPGQLPPAFQEEYGSGEFTKPFDEDMYFGKLDLAVGTDHYFELTAKVRKESEITDIGGIRLPSAATANINEDTRVDARWQWTGENWLNDAHIGYEKSFWSPQPTEFSNGYWLADGNWWDTIARRGGGDNYQDKGQDGWSLQDDFTWYGLQGHTIKMGAKYKSIDVNTLEQNKFNPQFYYDIHQSTTVPTHVEFGAPVSALGDGTVGSSNEQFGLYIQDDWEVNAKLTLNLGVRWDYESTPSYEDFVTPSNVAAAMRASNAALAGSGVNVEDYISTGGNRSADKNNWAPRLGFSYDLNADQRHVIFGGAGRSYDRNLFDYLQNEVSKGSWSSFAFDFNSAAHPCSGSNCLAWNPAYLDPDNLRALAVAGVGREVYLNNNNLDVPYADQFSLGMRNVVEMGGNDWTIESTLSHVESHDGIAFLLGNRRPDGSFFPPGATDPPPWGQGFAPFGNMILATNALETQADSFLLRVEKPYDTATGWGVNVAYTFTDASQNSPVNGFPGAFNMPTIDGYGWFDAMVAKHRLVTTAIYDGPWDITLSAKLTYATGIPRYVQDCNEVSWSLCHFTYYVPDEDFKQFDLAANKEFALGNRFRFRLRADLLNVFNWSNYSGYDDWMGGANEPMNPNFGKPNSISLPTRTFKLSLGLSW
ncbi:MAG TPA: TonB-dependent receptor [Thermomonas sp.]|nr:TonB-dependent receptor [Thermomonas sp.]